MKNIDFENNPDIIMMRRGFIENLKIKELKYQKLHRRKINSYGDIKSNV